MKGCLRNFLCATGEQCEALAAAMLGALTVLEGLLPALAPGVILSQLIGPSTSRRGDGEQSAPTVPVQLLLAPDVHRLASPQILNRVAGLLVQVIAASNCRWLSRHVSANTMNKTRRMKLPNRVHAGNQGDRRQGGFLSGAPAAAPAAADLPCHVAVIIQHITCSAGCRQVTH